MAGLFPIPPFCCRCSKSGKTVKTDEGKEDEEGEEKVGEEDKTESRKS
jgi:hypothetical protein